MNTADMTAAELSAYWASPEGQAAWKAQREESEREEAEMQAKMISAPRALRRREDRERGKVTRSYDVLFDGEIIGQILQVRRYGLWYMKQPGQKGLGMDYSSRQQAAVSCVRHHIWNQESK